MTRKLSLVILICCAMTVSSVMAGFLLNPDIPTVIAVSQDGTMAAVAFAPEDFGKGRLKKLIKGRDPGNIKPCGSLAFYMIGESENQWSAMPTGTIEDPAITGIITMHFIPGTRCLATKTIDGNIQIRNEGGATQTVIYTGDMRNKLPLFSNQAFHLTPDGTTVISPNGASELVFYSLADGTETGRIPMGMARITTVCVDPTGRYVAASDEDGNIGVWELGTHILKYKYTSKTTRMQKYCSLGFSADGNRFGALIRKRHRAGVVHRNRRGSLQEKSQCLLHVPGPDESRVPPD